MSWKGKEAGWNRVREEGKAVRQGRSERTGKIKERSGGVRSSKMRE